MTQRKAVVIRDSFETGGKTWVCSAKTTDKPHMDVAVSSADKLLAGARIVIERGASGYQYIGRG